MIFLTRKLEFAQELIDFIDNSPSAFHVVENVKKELIENGFVELEPSENWKIEKSG
ncbi:M18 family aminopeptidase, partial [Anaerosalibacter bizertensis]|nr:M18 family aminopeptidase [Anaerosalibacter bizertensis]